MLVQHRTLKANALELVMGQSQTNIASHPLQYISLTLSFFTSDSEVSAFKATNSPTISSTMTSSTKGCSATNASKSRLGHLDIGSLILIPSIHAVGPGSSFFALPPEIWRLLLRFLLCFAELSMSEMSVPERARKGLLATFSSLSDRFS